MHLSTLLPPLLHGVVITLKVTALSALLATAVSLVLGFGRLAHNPLFRFPSAILIEVGRGASAVVLLFWFYFALPLLGVSLGALTAGVLALGFSYGAYGAEVVRGAVLQVPRGQIEAGIALNFSYLQRVRFVTLPQATLAMLPPMGNLLIDLLKGTSLVSLITLSDVTFRAKLEQEAVGHVTEVFTLLLLIYFVLCFVLTRLVRLLERRVSRYLRVYLPVRAMTHVGGR
jgi:polar amino acid transport system permease protein